MGKFVIELTLDPVYLIRVIRSVEVPVMLTS